MDQALVKATSMNSHDCRGNYQMQVASSEVLHEMFKGLKTVIGKHTKAMSQPFINRVFENPDNIVGYCSDASMEQKLVIPAGH